MMRARFGAALKLDRRAVLRGAGATVALPLLDAMIDGNRAQAAARPTCFLTFFTPNGIYSSAQWWPSESGVPNYNAPAWMEPLLPHRADFTLVSGLSKRETPVTRCSSPAAPAWTQ